MLAIYQLALQGPLTYGGELLHVDMFAHNKSGIACRDKNRRSETVVNHKRDAVLAACLAFGRSLGFEPLGLEHTNL
jgi:hypothetical protein